MRRAAFLFLVGVASMACKSASSDGAKPTGSSGTAPTGAPAAPRVRVAASIFPVYDLVRRVGGDRVDAVLVLPAGRSEHDYDPSPKEIASIASSKLAVTVGLGLDAWLGKIVKSAAGGVPIFELGPAASPRKPTATEVGEEAVEEAQKKAGHAGDHDEHEHGALDPHVWLDPVRMLPVADALAVELAKIAPADRAGFEQRAAALKEALGKVHEDAQKHRATWQKTTIVTFHGSMGYFAERYGLTIAAVLEPFPGKEPTPRYLKEVLVAVQKSKPAALFSEPQLDPRPARVVADQAKIPLFELDPVGGSPDADSYEKLFAKNLAVLDKALR